MPGFYSSISNEEDIVFAQNADFSGEAIPSQLNGLQEDGQLWIGTSTENDGGTHINVGVINSSTLDVQFNTPNISIETKGGAQPIEKVALDLGPNNPVTADATGQIDFTGGFHSFADFGTPVVTRGPGPTTYELSVQIADDYVASSIQNAGLCSFDSADFSVDVNGFVSLAGAGAGQTITGDDTTALSPTAGNWNILGRSGSKTGGSGSTLTVRSPPYADQAAPTSVTLNSGSFATGAITLTTPVSAGLLDGDLLEFVATNGVLTIQLAATQVAHLGNTATSAAGTITGTATGDALCLRYQASTNDWWATSIVGIWVLA